jgi:SOS response regulatory protein OraA/RecX
MPAERNSALAYLATTELSPQIVGEYLAKSPLRAEYYSEIYKVLKQNENESSTKEDRISLIAKTVMSLAPAKAIDEALASLAVKTFSREKIEEAFNGLSFSEREPTPEKIDELLAVGVKKALIDINDKGYRKLVENGAKGIIELGLAIFHHGTKVKAAFGPERG